MKIINNNIIVKTTPDNRYGLGKDGKAYTKKLTTHNGHLVQKWVQVHYASYEKLKALKLLNAL